MSTFNFEEIPQEPRALPQWCDYKLDPLLEKGKPKIVKGKCKKTKVPYHPNGQKASSTAPATWTTFELAKAAYQDLEGVYDGICFMLARDNGIVFIDLDNCIKDGVIDPWAVEIVNRFNSYTEKSQSGKGLHILIKGQKPGPKCRTLKFPGIEIYDHARQCCLTGNVWENHLTITSRQGELNRLYLEIFGKEEARPRPVRKPTGGPHRLSDEALLLKAKTAKDGSKFEALWNGSTLGYNGDDSAADMALMNILAFWTSGDAAQMERLFSQSRLGQRDKWRDRSDYRDRTIRKALSEVREFYEPSKPEANAKEETTISEDDLLKIEIPANPRFKTNLEPDNFIQEFIRYGETVTDSYPDYWFAGSLFCLSVIANRNIVIKLRQGPVYPNVWINLLGLSSISRKSTSIDKTDLAIAAANIDPGCKMPDEFSPEAMIEMLDLHPRAYMIKDESAGLLAVMKKDYMRGLKDALMQLFDGKDINRELRTSRRKADKTSFRVEKPYLCLMLATTPGSFAANTELLDVTSGWLPRFLHFFPNHVKDRWLPLEEGVPENDTLSAGVHARLIKLKTVFYDQVGPFGMHISADAKVFWEAWQKARANEIQKSRDDRKAQYNSRLEIYALKMAMLFTIGRADYVEDMKISLEHIQEACRLVDEYFMPMALTVADLVGKAADKNLMDKIISVVTSRGGKISKRDLMKATHVKRKDLDESLEALEESGEIKRATISNQKGRPTVWVILSSDSDNSHIVHNVYNVYSSILSHQKEISKDVSGEVPCDNIDNRDNETKSPETAVLEHGTICPPVDAWDNMVQTDPLDGPRTGKIDRLTPSRKHSPGESDEGVTA